MSATATSTQVAVRYRWTYQLRCLGQQSDQHIGADIGRYRHTDRHISIDTLAKSRSIC